MASILIWAAIIGLIVYSFRHPHWFRRSVLYRRTHLESVEARRPFCVATKKLSERELYKLIKQKLPDSDSEKSCITLTPGTHNLKTDESQLHFAVLGNWWVGGAAGTVQTGDGRKRPSTVRFSVVVDHKHDETIATLVSLTWTERKGIFERYKDLTRAQDKMLAIIQGVDSKAKAFTEG